MDISAYGDEIYEYGKHLPPGPILMSIRYLDKIPVVSDIWRSCIPFELATPPHGILSVRVEDVTFPILKAPSDVPGGILSFITSSDTILGDITTPLAILVVLTLALFLNVLKKKISLYSKKFGIYLASQSQGKAWCEENSNRMIKFGEYSYRLVFHSAISLYGIFYFSDKIWWDSSRGGTIHFFLSHPNHSLEPGMIWYYMIQAAYHVENLIHTILISIEIKLKPSLGINWSATKRGDFTEMMVHHAVTVSLISLSSYFRLTRIGSAVILIHDISDIVVDLVKLANFIKWKQTTIFFFVANNVIWFCIRLCFFPSTILRSVFWESELLMWEWCPPEYYYTYNWLVVVFMLVIQFLNFFWFYLFLKIGWVLVTKGERHDLTEHKKGEKEI